MMWTMAELGPLQKSRLDWMFIKIPDENRSTTASRIDNRINTALR